MMKTNLALLFAGLMLAASVSAQTTVYSDDFSGAASVDLNGTAPDIRPGAQTWTAATNFDSSGSNTVVTTATSSTAILPFTAADFASNTIYTLEVDVKFDASGANTSWLALGFTNRAGGTGNMANAAGSLLLMRQNGRASHLVNNSTTNVTAAETAIGTFTSTEWNTLRLVIDTSSTTWKTTAYVNGSIVGTGLYDFSPSALTGVGFSSSGANAAGAFRDFTLVASAIPEPGSFAALAGLATLGFVVARRRRAAA